MAKEANIDAQIVRRLASIQRWTAALNYVMMYPEAVWEVYLGVRQTMPDKPTQHEAMTYIAEKIEIHSRVLKGLLNERG